MHEALNVRLIILAIKIKTCSIFVQCIFRPLQWTVQIGVADAVKLVDITNERTSMDSMNNEQWTVGLVTFDFFRCFNLGLESLGIYDTHHWRIQEFTKMWGHLVSADREPMSLQAEPSLGFRVIAVITELPYRVNTCWICKYTLPVNGIAVFEVRRPGYRLHTSLRLQVHDTSITMVSELLRILKREEVIINWIKIMANNI